MQKQTMRKTVTLHSRVKLDFILKMCSGTPEPYKCKF